MFGVKGGGTGGVGHRCIPPTTSTCTLRAICMPSPAPTTCSRRWLTTLVYHRQRFAEKGELDGRQISWGPGDGRKRSLSASLQLLVWAAKRTARARSRFDITAASEVMAVLALSTGYDDQKHGWARIVVGATESGQPVTADDLQATGAMVALLRDALLPNLVQTMEGGPRVVHCGPFANIAHGCSSVLATKFGLS